MSCQTYSRVKNISIHQIIYIQDNTRSFAKSIHGSYSQSEGREGNRCASSLVLSVISEPITQGSVTCGSVGNSSTRSVLLGCQIPCSIITNSTNRKTWQSDRKGSFSLFAGYVSKNVCVITLYLAVQTILLPTMRIQYNIKVQSLGYRLCNLHRRSFWTCVSLSPRNPDTESPKNPLVLNLTLRLI